MMENEFLNALSVNVTIVSSLVAIAAVSICSILTAVITQRGARKAKQSELIFHEMVMAYYSFINACDSFAKADFKEVPIRTADESAHLTEAYTRSLLFASKETSELLTKYVQMITESSIRGSYLASKGNLSDEEMRKEMSATLRKRECRASLIRSMQNDLRK